MTGREKEILDMIRNTPMVSQQEIADALGIARSSVAVHIANLMKKGYIKGKGYILKDRDYVTVIGGANIDIIGFPTDVLKMEDSNPGKVKISLGGVGRNISENLAKMGVDTKLITAVGDDVYGRKILNECKLSQIDMDNSLILKNLPSSTYLSVLDENGDMKLALSDMDITDEINIDFIREKSLIIKNSRCVVVDTNLKKEVIEYLVTNFKGIDFFVDTVSTVKGKKIKNFIGAFHTIKPNRLEAEELTGIRIDGEKDIKKAIKYFLDSGVRRVFISLGKDGIYYGDNQNTGYIKPQEIKIINATGAGDAFTAGLVYSYLNDFDIKNSTKFAMAASLIALSHENTINPNMSIKRIEEIMKEMK
ncbi:pseudouridine kinase [Maledivibacter halophilus]|uniref:Pseudouridine kinase n=1 Tax=Maledivibacter halophilus TaxID=36842 RepID=A0A1T5JDS0_9FIRM|nr:pseudouridine kinase [Maledivibacter halophilus]